MQAILEIVREVWKSTVGKIGIALLFVLIAISIYVPISFPKDFGKSAWSNPEYWADNPKIAPPFWVTWFDKDRAHHYVFKTPRPRAGTHVFSAETQTNPPTFLSMSISDVTFKEIAPVIEVYLAGKEYEVFLYRHVVQGAGDTQKAPHVRYSEFPYRANITSDKDVLNKVQGFFDTLKVQGEENYYIKIFAELESPQDTIGEIKFVVGGDAYGWLGTDNIGRDVFKGVLFGAPIALLIALPASLLANFLGATAGGVSGYSGGWKDTLIQRLSDVISNIPLLPILIFLVFLFGPKLLFIILILAFFGWTGLAIQLRPWIFQIRESGFVEYSRAKGFSFFRVVFLHILPQTMPYLVLNFIFFIPSAILAEAGLSFLGLGDPSLPTWGQILQQGFNTGAVYLGYWWWILPPGIAIIVATLTFFLFALSLEKILEPRLRRE